MNDFEKKEAPKTTGAKGGFTIDDLQTNPELVNDIPAEQLDVYITQAEEETKKVTQDLTCKAQKYDKLKSTDKLKYHTICDSESLKADFDNFMGKENLNRFKEKKKFNFKKQLNTQFGQVELNITYRAEYSDLYISLPDTQTTGLSLRIELDEEFNPKCFILIDDQNSYFATLFEESGFKQFSQHVGTPKPEAFKKTLQAQENYIKTTKMLREMTADQKRRSDITEQYSGEPGVFVNQAHFKSAPLGTPLATAGINTCAGLVIIDRKKGVHYLAHVDSSVSVESMKKSLIPFGDFKDQEIYFMEGVTPSGTMQNMLTAILDNPEALKKVKFLHGDNKMFGNVTIHNGKIYNAPDNTNDWKKEGTHF